MEINNFPALFKKMRMEGRSPTGIEMTYHELLGVRQKLKETFDEVTDYQRDCCEQFLIGAAWAAYDLGWISDKERYNLVDSARGRWIKYDD